MIGQAISIAGQGGKSGRWVAEAVVPTWGGLSGVPDAGLRESGDSLTAAQESAEAIGGRQPEEPNGMKQQNKQMRPAFSAEGSVR